MIRHGIQIIDWLASLGSSKSRVLPDLVEFRDGIQMGLDTATAPGNPVGTQTHFSVWLSDATGGVKTWFLDGGIGGAVIDFVTMNDATATANAADGLIFSNRRPGTLTTPFTVVSENCGTRQFDTFGPNRSNQRGVVPFSSFNVTRSNAAHSAGGARREASIIPIGGVVFPVSIYCPPGINGWAMVTTGQTDVQLSGRLLALRTTNQPKS